MATPFEIADAYACCGFLRLETVRVDHERFAQFGKAMRAVYFATREAVLDERAERAIAAMNRFRFGAASAPLPFSHAALAGHVDPAELPVPVRHSFEALCTELQSVRPLRGETAAQATIRKMSDHEAQAFAKRIVELWAAADARNGSRVSTGTDFPR